MEPLNAACLLMDDDDAPLATLAKPGPVKTPISKPPATPKSSSAKPPPKFDDDTPLVALAGPNKNRASTGKPKPKTPGGKDQKASSGSSDSSSSSSGSSSGSDSDQPLDKKFKASVPKRPLKRVKTGDDDDEQNVITNKRSRSVKEQVVCDVLCRWWYVFDPWPPQEDEYYAEELRKRHLRKILVQDWEWVPDEDAQGFRKVYELSQYRGLFRDSEGNLIDLRPQETCPCYTNLMKRDLPDLYHCLAIAYENQIKDLENSLYVETHLENTLKAALTKTRDKLAQAEQSRNVKAA